MESVVGEFVFSFLGVAEFVDAVSVLVVGDVIQIDRNHWQLSLEHRDRKEQSGL